MSKACLNDLGCDGVMLLVYEVAGFRDLLPPAIVIYSGQARTVNAVPLLAHSIDGSHWDLAAGTGECTEVFDTGQKDSGTTSTVRSVLDRRKERKITYFSG